MRRVIVDYAKLTHEILNLLVEKFPDGYDDSNIIRFRNAQNELVEAVEVRTEDTIYLVKISTKLADRIENYDEDDEIAAEIEPIDDGINLDDDDDVSSDDDDTDEYKEPSDDKGDDDDDDDDDDEESDVSNEDDDEDDED
ncbi:DNA primase [Flavobacterium nackdongense]|uniref:DNA primase n=1 Tax=Flavobacterium nackdongense TaxID=2547394 RepID=A0A4P6Y5C9_9FLAO|nr:DNA primase [Flavobacterium nackdongense]QBN17326.1 DNA primase [Flavobacterium nackdongense]